VWQDRGRPEDLLWSGTAYRDFSLWRERYPGGLTATEEAFAEAATRLAGRRRRRRRIGVAAILTTALAVAGVTAGLWRRSEVARQHAQAEALRAEAGKLLALGRTYLDADPTAALAYAKGSLDLFDTPEARTFALEVLWRGPVARILPVDRIAKELRLSEDPSGIEEIKLSPDGRWLASRSESNRILLFSRETGAPRALPDQPETTVDVLSFGPDSDVLVTGGPGQSVRLWSVPDLRERRTVALGGRLSEVSGVGGALLIRTEAASQQWLLQELRLPDGEPKAIGTFPRGFAWDVNPTHTWLVYVRGRTVVLRSLDANHRERILGELRDEVVDISFSPTGDRVASLDHSSEIRIWSPDGSAVGPIRVLKGPKYAGIYYWMFDPRGRRLINLGPNNAFYVWDFDDPPDAEAVVLGRPGPSYMPRVTFDARGQWLATSWGQTTIELWPLASPRKRALHGFASTIFTMAFTPDGRWLAACSGGEPARIWPLNPTDGSARNLVPEDIDKCMQIAMHPQDSQVLVTGAGGKVLLVPTEGGRPRQLLDRRDRPSLTQVAFDRQGRRAVAVRTYEGLLRAWDLPSGRERVYSIPDLTDADWSGLVDVAGAPDGRLYVSGQTGMGVRRLALPAETEGTVSSETLFAAGSTRLDLSRDGRLLLVLASQSRESRNASYEELRLFDLTRNTSRGITTHGSRLGAAVLSPSGRVIVSADTDGVVRVGPVSGAEPHLLFGHKGPVSSLAVSPDERWIASASDDVIHLWPMPDVTKPPLHTLSHAELMAKLDTLTNLRVVRDASSSTGWKLDIGPFNGWKDVPTW